MSARSQVILCDQGGGEGEEVTEAQWGGPDRLGEGLEWGEVYERGLERKENT